MTARKPATSQRPVQRCDRVYVDSSATEYEVVAVGSAGHDVFVRDADGRMAGGTWVHINSVHLVEEEGR